MSSWITAGPNFDDPVLRGSASFPPEHGVDICQVGQRHVGRKSMRGTRQVQLPAVLVDLIMLKPAKRFVGREDDFSTVLPVAVIVLLFVSIGTTVVTATFLEESVSDTFLSLVFPQMISDFARIPQRSAATVQSAMMMLPA